MPSIHETAYPRLKRAPTPDELARVYTPTRAEVQLAQQVTKGPVARIGFFVVLKTFQRLGYVVPVADVPAAVIAHIAQAVDIPLATLDLRGYDTSGTRRRHVQTIRAYVGVQPYGPSARRVLLQAMWTAADTKTDLADLINVAIEELVRQRWELPAFSTLQRAAQHVRSFTHRRWYQHIVAALALEAQVALDALLVPDPVTQRTSWQALKQEPDHPSLTHLKALVDRLTWLTTLPDVAPVLAALLPARIKHWAAEAATLDAARMLHVEPRKRMTLVAALVHVQTAQTRDDLAQMFIRRMQTIHHRAHEALLAYQAAQRGSTDALVTILRDVVAAYQQDGTPHERFAAVDAVLAPASDAVLTACDAYLAHAGTNYYPFVWAAYKSHRATLFRIMDTLTFQPTSQDTRFVAALQFLQAHAHSKAEWLPLIREVRDARGRRWESILDVSWIPDGWWRLVTGQYSHLPRPRHLNRRHFETCVFSELLVQLKAGNIAIVGSDAFADLGAQFIPWAAYHAEVAAYGQMVGFPTDGQAFVAYWQQRLARQAQATDAAMPTNHAVRIVNGEPVLGRPAKHADPDGLRWLETQLATHLEPRTVLDVLRDTAHWLDWTAPFGPISGHAGKLEHPVARYLVTTFCYGCNLQDLRGVSQVRRTCS